MLYKNPLGNNKEKHFFLNTWAHTHKKSVPIMSIHDGDVDVDDDGTCQRVLGGV